MSIRAPFVATSTHTSIRRPDVEAGRASQRVCVYAYTVSTAPAQLVRDARFASGLSIRALAEQAGVAATTITRIESGRIDPTVGTLRDILHAAGRGLRLDAPRAARIHLAELVGAWSRRAGEDRPDWTRLRTAIDHLTLHPEETDDAISPAPQPSGSRMMDALLAGIADKLADDGHLARSTWTSAVPSLEDDTFLIPTTPRQRRAIRDATPSQLAARRLFIDAETLWRPTVTHDA